ncbi:MurR/RpiR family transcriptional regulator [Bosea thiooxidans]
MSQSLKPSTDLSNRIAQIYPSLSNGHRRAADFVLQHPLDVATMTIEGLAEGSGTSNATVTRFVRALGYGSYGEFRSALSAALKFAHDPVDSFAGARA